MNEVELSPLRGVAQSALLLASTYRDGARVQVGSRDFRDMLLVELIQVDFLAMAVGLLSVSVQAAPWLTEQGIPVPASFPAQASFLAVEIGAPLSAPTTDQQHAVASIVYGVRGLVLGTVRRGVLPPLASSDNAVVVGELGVAALPVVIAVVGVAAVAAYAWWATGASNQFFDTLKERMRMHLAAEAATNLATQQIAAGQTPDVDKLLAPFAPPAKAGESWLAPAVGGALGGVGILGLGVAATRGFPKVKEA